MLHGLTDYIFVEYSDLNTLLRHSSKAMFSKSKASLKFGTIPIKVGEFEDRGVYTTHKYLTVTSSDGKFHRYDGEYLW